VSCMVITSGHPDGQRQMCYACYQESLVRGEHIDEWVPEDPSNWPRKCEVCGKLFNCDGTIVEVRP